MARSKDEKRAADRDRATGFLNVRLPRELVDRVDALRVAQEVAPARERYVVALLEAEVTRREASS